MEINIKGQVIHKRSISKKLIFFDIIRDNENNIEHSKQLDHSPNSDNTIRKTVVLKSAICGEEIMSLARTTSSKIHVGDIVKFNGNFEGDTQSTFQASSFNVITRWEKSIQEKVFLPFRRQSNNIGITIRGSAVIT